MTKGLWIAALLWCATLVAQAAPTIDGNRAAGDGYTTATNTAATVDSNVNFGFGDSAKSEHLNAVDDANFLYVFVEGSLHSGNRLFVVIDSDNNAATGVSGKFPVGTYGESSALRYFAGLPAGGYDLAVVIAGNGGSPATGLGLVVLAYTSGGAISSENYLGAIGLSGDLPQAVIRGTTGTLSAAELTGDGAGAGIELKIPKAWLLNASFNGSYKLVAMNGNGSNDYWSDSFIPQLAASGNIGSTGGTDSGVLTGLTAPIYTWQVPVVNPTVTLSSTATDPTKTSPIPMTATFSQSVTGFVAGDINVTNATVSNFVPVSGTVYTFNLVPTAAGAITAQVPAAAATAGATPNVASAVFQITYDNVAPTVLLQSPQPSTTGANPIKYKVTFSEAVTGFDITDITVTNGTASNLVTLNSQAFAFDVAPGVNGVVGVTVPANAVTDLAGNYNTAGSLNRTYSSSATDPGNKYNGAAIYVVGEGSALYGYASADIGKDPMLQLHDDGTNGDAVASDGIYSITFTPLTGTGAAKLNWKVASANYDISIPSGTNNSVWRPQAGVATTFYLDTTTKADSFIPNPGLDGAVALLYTSPSFVKASDTIRASGDFNSELGSGADYSTTATNIIMHDDGLNGDATASDGIYALRFTGIPVGNYSFKVTANGAFTIQVGNSGYDSDNAYNANGGGISFPVLATTDTVTLNFAIATGRYRIQSTNPLASAGPPWYALSPSWGTTPSAANQMYDDGTHGDITSSDGVYTRQMRVANVATTHALRIAQNIGAWYPLTTDFSNGGGYPFQTTTANQQVLVQFDTNVRNDGFSPKTRYAWTDPASRRTPTYVQVVGTIQTALGGNSDWNSADTNFEAKDLGTNGDVTAGDLIYALSVTGGPATTGKVYKAIGGTNGFTYQFGGEGDGATYKGNNPSLSGDTPASPIFQIDAVTGRVGLGASKPVRPATINATTTAPNAARGWALYN
jgi:hypothetical protein